MPVSEARSLFASLVKLWLLSFFANWHGLPRVCVAMVSAASPPGQPRYINKYYIIVPITYENSKPGSNKPVKSFKVHLPISAR